MNLIGPLLAGIRGGENGSGQLFRRGTSTRATWYGSFEGDDANSSGADITLDANGSAEVYVDELVDVIVKDPDGNTVRSFTEGYSSPHVEVRTQSFTGADYTTANSAAGNPTTLQAVLDLWKTNSGAPDWKVLLDATNTTLKDAISRVAGPPFFNVKATAYGATGDGATDDTNAIQTAINAAVAAGGGIVWFPPGDYKITAALSVPKEASLWGSGPGGAASTGASRIFQITNTEVVLTFPAGGTVGDREVRGLQLEHSVSSTTYVVTQTNSSDTPIHFVDCHLGVGLETDTIANVFRATFTRCVFKIAGGTSRAILNNAGQLLIVRDCWFIVPAAGYTPTDALIASTANFTLVEGCYFDFSAMTSGTAYALIPVGAGQTTAMGNLVRDPTGGTVAMFRLNPAENVRFYEDNNFSDSAGGSATLYSVGSVTGNATPDWRGFYLGSRERRQYYVSDNSASLQLNALEFGVVFIDRTDAAAQTLTTNFVLPNGSFTMVMRNNTGGAGATITPSSASFRPSATYSIATAGNLDVRRFRGVDIVGTVRWLADSTPQNNI